VLMGLAALAAITLAWCSGGSLAALARVQWRDLWLMPAGLALQVLAVNVLPDLPRPFGAGVHLLSYLLAGVFLVRNLTIAGLPLITFGAALNAVTIAVNGGVLPASAAALQAAGWDPDSGGFANSAALAHPRLAFLGDNYVTPGWLPLANVYSIGDLIIVTGVCFLAYRATRTRPRHRATSSRFTAHPSKVVGASGARSGRSGPPPVLDLPPHPGRREGV
jgi:hypothetical protein